MALIHFLLFLLNKLFNNETDNPFNLASSQDTIHLIKNDTIQLKKLQHHKIYTDRLPQLVYAELGGPGLLSANYDTRLNKTVDGVGLRVGLGYNFNNSFKLTTIPFGFNYLFGHSNKAKYLELGINETILIAGSVDPNNYTSYSLAGKNVDPGKTYNFTSFLVGYRSQPNEGGFNFRAGLMPFFFEGESSISIYLSFGFNF